MSLALHMSLHMQPRLVSLLECSVCEQFMDPDDPEKGARNLVGAARFHACCCCGQEVPEGGDDDYKLRYAAWERKRRAA